MITKKLLGAKWYPQTTKQNQAQMEELLIGANNPVCAATSQNNNPGANGLMLSMSEYEGLITASQTIPHSGMCRCYAQLSLRRTLMCLFVHSCSP